MGSLCTCCGLLWVDLCVMFCWWLTCKNQSAHIAELRPRSLCVMWSDLSYYLELILFFVLWSHKMFFPAKVGEALGNDLPKAWQLCNSYSGANVLCDLSILKMALFCFCCSQKNCTDIPFHCSSYFIMKTQGFHVSKDFL